MTESTKYKIIVSDRAKRMLGIHIRFMSQINKEAAVAKKRENPSSFFSVRPYPQTRLITSENACGRFREKEELPFIPEEFHFCFSRIRCTLQLGFFLRRRKSAAHLKNAEYFHFHPPAYAEFLQSLPNDSKSHLKNSPEKI